MKKKIKKEVSNIKKYTSNEVITILNKFENDFLKGETTEIGIWEYENLKDMIPSFSTENRMFTNSSKDYTKEFQTLVGISKSGNLYPYIETLNGPVKIKGGFKWMVENGFGNRNLIKIDSSGNLSFQSSLEPLQIICPECKGTNLSLIDNKYYCNNPCCTFWYKIFYEDMLKMIEDKKLKHWIKINVCYTDFPILNKIFTKELLRKYSEKSFTDNQLLHLNNYLETINKNYGTD